MNYLVLRSWSSGGERHTSRHIMRAESIDVAALMRAQDGAAVESLCLMSRRSFDAMPIADRRSWRCHFRDLLHCSHPEMTAEQVSAAVDCWSLDLPTP